MAPYKYHGKPFRTHLQHVVTCVTLYGRPDLADLAWLHDVLDYAPSYGAAMREQFPAAYPVVKLLTSPNVSYVRREELLRAQIAGNEAAQAVAAAERICDLSYALGHAGAPPILLHADMFRSTMAAFLAAIPLAPEGMQSALELLSRKPVGVSHE